MDKKESKELMNKVRDIFNEWDFLSAAEFEVYDEYDCIVGPVARLVSQGTNREYLKQFIEQELEDHFGLEGHYSKDNFETTLDKLEILSKQY